MEEKPVVQNPAPAKSSNKFLIIFAVFALIVISLMGGYILGTGKNNSNLPTPEEVAKKIPVTPSPTITQEVQPSITVISTPTSAKESYSEATGVLNQKKYFAPKFGISFLYLEKQGTDLFAVKEDGNKLYVYSKAYPYTQGQYIELFSKLPTDTLSQGIKKQILPNIPESECFIKASDNKNLPNNFEKATISYPVPSNSDQPGFTFGEKCTNYRETNGISYFLGDKNHPDRFLFFSIGQYGIMADEKNNKLWQDTIESL